MGEAYVQQWTSDGWFDDDDDNDDGYSRYYRIWRANI